MILRGIAAFPRHRESSPGRFTALPSPASPQLERTAGSVEFQLFDGAGSARVRFRGNFLGHVGRGRIVATKAVTLSSCERRRALSSTLKECRGTNLGFRTPGWTRWRLRFVGRNTDAPGFVRGCTTLNGVDTGYRGRFQIGEVTRPWPLEATKYRLGAGYCPPDTAFRRLCQDVGP